MTVSATAKRTYRPPGAAKPAPDFLQTLRGLHPGQVAFLGEYRGPQRQHSTLSEWANVLAASVSNSN